ncbi:MAG: hypothetical protein QXF41_00375 [Candidatus Micrarchaeaceae archaeon]
MLRKYSIDSLIDENNLPKWLKGYALTYLRKDPINMLSKAVGFVFFGRKHGHFDEKYVYLPNKAKFRIKDVAYVTMLFRYGEKRLAEITGRWSKNVNTADPYISHFMKMSSIYAKHVMALNSMLAGLGADTEFEPNKAVSDVFDYIEKINLNYGRILAIDLILRYSYAKTFGFAFYRTFYPVSPEFMRGIGKVFASDTAESLHGEQEAIRMLDARLIESEYLLGITRELLKRVCISINSTMPVAKRMHIENEILFLRDVSIAYPLHIMSEHGIIEQPDEEAKAIISESAKNEGG